MAATQEIWTIGESRDADRELWEFRTHPDDIPTRPRRKHRARMAAPHYANRRPARMIFLASGPGSGPYDRGRFLHRRGPAAISTCSASPRVLEDSNRRLDGGDVYTVRCTHLPSIVGWNPIASGHRRDRPTFPHARLFGRTRTKPAEHHPPRRAITDTTWSNASIHRGSGGRISTPITRSPLGIRC